MNLPEGIRDLLPVDLIRQEKLRRLVLNTFNSWGYQTVLPPSLESLKTLEKGRPKLVKEAFKVVDVDGQLLALRPDLTMPIARLAATRLSSLERPLRLCYAAVVFRQNKNADSHREIYQAGIELIGSSSKDKPYSLERTNKANLECLSILLETLDQLQIADYKIVLTHTDLWRYAGEIFHRVEKHLEMDLSAEIDAVLQKGDFLEYQKVINKIEERCKRSFTCPSELKTLFDSSKNESPLNYLKKACFQLTGKPDEVLAYLDSDSDLYNELSTIIALEEIFGPEKFFIDFTLRPDRKFYTGLYFEVIVPSRGQSIGAGGRYNNLISCFGGSEPAIGFSLHIEALLKHSQNPIIKQPFDKKKCVNISCEDTSKQGLIERIKESRDLRKNVEVVVLD